ncbi:MAG TPA: ACT domain-containing protein [Solirubrobacterales bacterium]|nr:ACT domain-containing protein [Solirubrobacterales bacterium]
MRTATELSLVVPEGAEPEGATVDSGWRVLRVAQAHDLEVTGVTAALAAPLTEIGVPIFILATFDTDHLLVQNSRFDEAIAQLRAAGHRITGIA